jgi:hypothetical protein
VKVDPVIVDEFIASLKVAVTADVMAMPVLVFVGVTAVIVGAVVATQLLVQVIPPPPLPPPHPAITRVAATSHQAARIRIIKFSLESFRRWIALISVRCI